MLKWTLRPQVCIKYSPEPGWSTSVRTACQVKYRERVCRVVSTSCGVVWCRSWLCQSHVHASCHLISDDWLLHLTPIIVTHVCYSTVQLVATQPPRLSTEGRLSLTAGQYYIIVSVISYELSLASSSFSYHFPYPECLCVWYVCGGTLSCWGSKLSVKIMGAIQMVGPGLEGLRLWLAAIYRSVACACRRRTREIKSRINVCHQSSSRYSLIFPR